MMSSERSDSDAGTGTPGSSTSSRKIQCARHSGRPVRKRAGSLHGEGSPASSHTCTAHQQSLAGGSARPAYTMSTVSDDSTRPLSHSGASPCETMIR